MLAKVEPAKLCKVCTECNLSRPIECFAKVKNKISQSVWRRNMCNECRDRQRTPEQRLLKEAKYRAKKKGLPFDLELSDIVIPATCPVYGMPMQYNTGWNSPSIDRIENNKGYTKDNIIIVSVKANSHKSTATLDELKQLVSFYDKLMSHK